MYSSTEQVYNIKIAGLHRGQQAIYDHPARYKVLRCGRRFGKTQLGVYLAVMCAIARGKVGWFAPETTYAREAWDRLVEVLGDTVVSANKQTRIIELVGGGSIEVWSLHDNEDAGRSRAYDLVIVDEAGLVPTLDKTWDSAISATLLDRKGTAYILGTSKVTGIGFRRLFQRANADPEWAAFRAKTIDNPFLPANIVDEVEKRRRYMSAAAHAAEYDGGDNDDAGTFFPSSLIENLIAEAADPLSRVNCDIGAEYAYDRDHAIGNRDLPKIAARPDEAGSLHLWLPLERDRKGMMRPPQRRPWAMGADISTGVGASNTIFAIGDAETGRKVAVFRATRVTPPEAARMAAIIGLWFGGTTGQATINFEANGPGQSFGQELVQLAYAGIMRRAVFGSRTHEAQDRYAYGWWSTPSSKEQLLIAYREDLTGGDFINPSAGGLRECLPYRYDEFGRVVTDVEDDGTHGDEVIADALLAAAMRAMPRVPHDVPAAPAGSEAWRDAIEKRAEDEDAAGW